MDVLVIGAGPAGVFAALRAADLGARATLVTSGAFGGMAANDGPVPVRTLAHAARLMREVRQLEDYGIHVGEPRLDYPALLARVRAVVETVRQSSTMRRQLEAAGVRVAEQAGAARFLDERTVETAEGMRFAADRIILCTGGTSRKLPIPGFQHLATHSDAWSLEAVPETMIVLGAGATGLQVASIFGAFGTKVALYETGPRIMPGEDEDVSAAVAEGYRARGIDVHEAFGRIARFEPTYDGIRMVYEDGEGEHAVEAALAVSAVGWATDAEGLNLAAAGVTLNARGFIGVDGEGRTSAPHIYAAGDVTGGTMLAPRAMQDGFAAASAALGVETRAAAERLVPVGSFTDPEYARVGATEAEAGEGALVTRAIFAEATRPIIDGRTAGFAKLIVDRETKRMLGCAVVGERAVDIVQVAAVAMAAEMEVDDLAHFPLSFPTYAGVLAQLAVKSAHALR
ncbi:MAG TPA: NAD(P)/FAD-dependent oxidoreductase [Allosphingosinicella sp.]|nr:NAD(P)/FAD-dependent oxidoreductase [Allosphingosinicella sp.]